MLSRLLVVKSLSRSKDCCTYQTLSLKSDDCSIGLELELIISFNQYSIFCGKTGITVHLKCFIVFPDPKNIGLDTNIVIVGPFNMKWGPKAYFVVAILNFQFLAGTVGLTSWFPQFLKSAYPKTPLGKVPCFLHKVHRSATNCNQAAPLYIYIISHPVK